MTSDDRTTKGAGARLGPPAQTAEEDGALRAILPLPDRPVQGVTPVDARPANSAPVEDLRPPKGAPNVVVVLLDDIGFGSTSTFGGPCETPALARVAKHGLKYTCFHATALAAPTRQALLTGRNHHSVGMGCTTEVAPAAPAYGGRLNSTATIAQILQMNGYSTSFFGKCDDLSGAEANVPGSYEHWPTLSGFDKFYGFLGGERAQRAPTLFDGMTPVEPSLSSGHFLANELTKQAVQWMKAQQALTPDKPFFMYFAPGATLASLTPKDWVDRYHGRFDRGWDRVREETLVRQKALRIVPRNTRLTPRPEGVASWDALSPEDRLALARLMESYAAYVSFADHHVGLLLDALEELRILDDTLFLYVTGDTFASSEGMLSGVLYDERYPTGWAHAMCTPYQWTRQVASHWGGTRRGMAVCWPSGIAARDDVRQQFHHVVDVAPTILEAARLPRPVLINGIAQKPIEGVSMLYSFDDAAAPGRHGTQYFEMMGNGGIYHDGWTALTKHRTPWITGITALPRFTEDRWELYDCTRDWSQAEDLSAVMPSRLEELKQLWLMEAAKYQVVPVDDRGAARVSPDVPEAEESLEDRPTPVLSPRVPLLRESAIGDTLSRGAGDGR